MKFLIGLVVGAIVAAAIGAAAIAYSFDDFKTIEISDRDKGEEVTRTLELRDFDKVDIRGVYELDVTVGPDFAVALSGEPDDLDRVEARVEGGELVLDQRKREKGERRRDHDGVTAVISMPALVALEVSGVVDGKIAGIAADAFKVEISGVGDMSLSGTCNSLDADVSGIGDLDADALQCKSVDVTVSGVGDANVYASESVDAEISGMGEISVSGSPEKVEKSGGMFAISVK